MKNILNIIANEYPEFTINVKLSDLIACNRELIKEVKSEFEKQIQENNEEKYLSIDEATHLLKVSKTTLWRWAKQNYLIPVEVGGKRRYKMSDIKKRLNGSNDEG